MRHVFSSTTPRDNCLLYTVYVAIVRRSPVIKCKSVNTFSELDTVVILLATGTAVFMMLLLAR